MLLAEVKGTIVSSAKLDTLGGRKLLLVEVITVRPEGLQRTGRQMVCVDAVGAGVGEVVITVMGSSARSAPDMGAVPTDAVVVGILDALNAEGQSLDLTTVNDAA